MGIIAIANISNNKKTIGLRLLDTDTKQIKDVPIQSVYSVLSSGKVQIENIGIKNNKVVGTNGTIERLPKIVGGQLVGKSPLIVINQIGDEGYTVSDFKGQIIKLRTADVIKYAKTHGISNGKVVNKDGKEFISSIVGEYNKIELPQSKPVVNVENSKVEANKVEVSKNNSPEHSNSNAININNNDNINRKAVKPIINIDDEEKKVKEKLRKKIEKQSNGHVEEEQHENLSAKIKCKDGMTVEQKLARSIMQMKKTHPFYFAIYSLLDRRESKDVQTIGVTAKQIVYNPEFIATLTEGELNYINLHEIGHIAMMHPLRKKHRHPEIFNIACDLYINKVLNEEFNLSPGKKTVVNGVEIQCPTIGCFSDEIDIVNDTPEKIYDNIMKELEQSSKSMNGSGSGQAKGGSSSSGSGRVDPDGSNSDINDSNDNEQLNGSGDSKGFRAIYKGREYELPNEQKDLLKGENKDEKSSNIEEIEVRQLLEQALIKTHGVGSGKLMRIVKEILAPKIDWKKLLRNKLQEISATISTLAKPDKRFISRNMVLPGPKNLDPDKLKGVKVCIDTSGSMSENELGMVYTHIKQMLKTYKAEAEVIYWDWDIVSTGYFNDYDSFKKIESKGGGGTNVNCVFEYFESKNCKIKPSVVIIFTDGYFGSVDTKYSRKYRDTIWVIYNNNSFVAPFGKVAHFK